MDPAWGRVYSPSPGNFLTTLKTESLWAFRGEGMWKKVVCVFSVEAAQVVILAPEKVLFERLLCRLVMTLLKSEAT